MPTSSPTRLAPLVPELIAVGDRRIEVFDVGTSPPGDPVVLVLTGAGDTARSWLPVQTELSRAIRVIAYERSGIGRSDSGSPRTLAAFVDEADAVLAAVVPHRRVILVGHSFGALVARVYAHRHPDRVAGLVLVDATPDLLTSDTLRRIGYRVYVESIAAARAALPRALFGWLVQRNVLPYYPGCSSFTRMLSPEAREQWRRAIGDLYLGDAVEEMRAVLPGTAEASIELGTAADPHNASPLGDMPVALLTSGTYGRGWIALHDAIARRYPNSTHELSGDRFHHVHMRHAHRVAHVVTSIVGAAAGSA